jgi:YHS domain-containing protein
MLRFILLSILLTIVFRAVARLWSGIVRGMQGQVGYSGPRQSGGASGVPRRGVQMARDPVCGTFVVPERAVALSASMGERIYFCSAACRDKYRSDPQAVSPAAHGRTA